MRHIPHSLHTWFRSGPLAAHVEAYERYLIEREYTVPIVAGYLGCLRHFAWWMQRRELDVTQISEASVAEFLGRHLPACDCLWPVRRDRISLRAALTHLLVVLRAAGVIPGKPISSAPVDEELRCFDAYMDRVRGLAPKTRSVTLRIVRRFLVERFGQGAIDVGAIASDDLREFYAGQAKLYGKPAHTGVVISAVRGYLRYRESLGDKTGGLIGALPYPANWTLASLPKGLTAEEVEKLVASLGQSGRSRRRADAIVRCALDLGLRSGEIAKISLDDIDWRAGTITLRHTKGRRDDVLPLPKATGRAIAAYLKKERPKTASRALFVRHIAPHDVPFGPDGVRKAIRQAYGRAGLPHTRSHLLRHTLATRLLDRGSSLKEVADLLRHRSLNTTLIYAKVDSRKLQTVAMPWPGALP